MRLYTAEAIKEQVHKLLCTGCEKTDACPICDYRELIDEILDAPTVDAVPVVRCKDCLLNGTARCAMNYYGQHKWNKPNDFCSWGERREDEQKNKEKERQT